MFSRSFAFIMLFLAAGHLSAETLRYRIQSGTTGKCWYEQSGTVYAGPCDNNKNFNFYLERVGTSQWFNIAVDRYQDYCVFVSGASQEKRVPFAVKPCDAGLAHGQFRFEETSPGAYHIRARHSGQCMHLDTNQNKHLWTWTCPAQDKTSEFTFHLFK